MAKKPIRRAARPATTTAERFAVIETTLEALPEQISNQIKASIIEAISGLAHVSDVQALAARVLALENSRAFSAGAVRVEQRQRGELHEWARTLLPWAFGLAATVLGFRALG